MQAKISGVFIFIGIVLLYLGIFGLASPFRFAVTGTPENFLTYTEVDPNSHITVNSASSVHFQSHLDEAAYLYSDKGTNYFGSSFTHKVDVKLQSTAMGPSVCFWALTNKLGELKGLWDAGETVINARCNKAAGATNYQFFLGEYFSTAQYYVVTPTTDIFTCDTWYYLTITKATTQISVQIFSDANRLTLKSTLQLTLHGDHKFRYIMPCITANIAVSQWGDADIANLAIDGVTPPPETGTIVVNAQYHDGTAWKIVPQTSPVYVTCDGVQKQAPATFSGLTVGTHTINLVTTSVIVSGVTYPFKAWEDTSAATTRQVSVSSGTTITLTTYYGEEQPPSNWDPFQDPLVKAGLCLTGVVSSGIGVIGLLPKKKPPQYFF